MSERERKSLVTPSFVHINSIKYLMMIHHYYVNLKKIIYAKLFEHSITSASSVKFHQSPKSSNQDWTSTTSVPIIWSHSN